MVLGEPLVLYISNVDELICWIRWIGSRTRGCSRTRPVNLCSTVTVELCLRTAKVITNPLLMNHVFSLPPGLLSLLFIAEAKKKTSSFVPFESFISPLPVHYPGALLCGLFLFSRTHNPQDQKKQNKKNLNSVTRLSSDDRSGRTGTRTQFVL